MEPNARDCPFLALFMQRNGRAGSRGRVVWDGRRFKWVSRVFRLARGYSPVPEQQKMYSRQACKPLIEATANIGRGTGRRVSARRSSNAVPSAGAIRAAGQSGAMIQRVLAPRASLAYRHFWRDRDSDCCLEDCVG